MNSKIKQNDQNIQTKNKMQKKTEKQFMLNEKKIYNKRK